MGAQRLDTLIAGVMKSAAREHGPLFAIQREWPRLVGKSLAAHTKPVSLRRGRLLIYVEQPGDNFTLSYARPNLLGRLHTMTQGRVEEIVIRPGKA